MPSDNAGIRAAFDDAFFDLRATMEAEWQRHYPDGRLPDRLAAAVLALRQDFNRTLSETRRRTQSDSQASAPVSLYCDECGEVVGYCEHTSKHAPNDRSSDGR